MPARSAKLPPDAEHLTRREAEIAALVADGLTNRDIATRLFISERTAEGHVERIRSKLGFRSRVQIAGWVADQRRSAQSGMVATTTTSAIQGATGAAGGATGPSVSTPSGSARSSLFRLPPRRTAAAVCAVVAIATAAGITAVALSRGTIATATNFKITTLAGTAARAFSSDGHPAIATDLSLPIAAIADAAGHVYFIDANRVREIAASGIVRTVAGTGDAAYGGDGGPATKAELNAPQSLAVDSAGNLFIADALNNRVRRVDSAGVITTVAGTGVAGFSGDGGAATAAQLNQPVGLAIGFNDDLYISDSGNDRVREVTPEGLITTVAGAGEDGYAGDGGPATSATMRSPRGLAFDVEGNLYIVDAFNDRIRRVDLNGDISTVAGTGQEGDTGDGASATEAELRLNLATIATSGSAVAVDSRGDIYLADTDNNCVRRIDVNGTITTVVGTGYAAYGGDGGNPAAANLRMPLSVAVAPNGDLLITDTGNGRVREVVTVRG